MHSKTKKILVDSEKKGIPVFVLTAKDKLSHQIINEYLNLAVKENCNVDFINGVEEVVNDFADWKQENNHLIKLPD